MSRIAYDPVKDKFARIIRHSELLRRIFYATLDLVFLRSWHIRKVLREHCRKLDRQGEWRLLDAGCGFGQYDRFILDEFDHVKITSIDIKADYIEDNTSFFSEQISEGRIRFDVADLLNYQDDTEYDAVICIDVLEHIAEDRKVMRNLSRCMKPGAYFLMHSPSHYSAEDADEDDSFVDEHARAGYSKEEIGSKLMESDLHPLKIHYTYGKWGHRAWTLLVKWPMVWFTRFGLPAAIPLLIYYPVVTPVSLLMNAADLYTANKKGTGIYALAQKI
ncbi:SAM-dependent methyltransferase [Rhodohalobacter mucosus]|uniref:Class I SAM-dependent methyltransferase n=1 Tax=Rhodohalobacter mucosus TaxID=2079485 RepID=A0A316TNK6_9BACT|nr:class I SAM-dependent methyltransferase [Rhodohalobacter mucosus]PWN06177.1 class I SAM-dependent methyltransferase [Rhodohalobacter mucosus]